MSRSRPKGWSEADTLESGGRAIACLVCGHDRFHQRRVLLNTGGMTFLGWDAFNRGAAACRCERCGYIMWFGND